MRKARAPIPVMDRLMPRVVSCGDCWEWTGYRQPRGYGVIKDGTKTRLTHRVVWEAINGPVPEGHDLDHLCRNTSCCNPEHLEPVPHRVNVLRGVGPTAINAKATVCKRGHAFDEANTYTWRGVRICRACRSRKRTPR